MTPTERSSKNTLILELPVPVIDQIGNWLAERPYKEVVNILNLIAQQANDQVLQSYGPPPPPSAEQENTGEHK